MPIRDRVAALIDSITRSIPPTPKRSSRRTRLKAVIGVVALIVVVFFFILRAKATTENLVLHWQPLSIVNIGLAFVIVLASFGLAAGLWGVLIRLLGGRVSWRETLRIYFLSSLPRYIPGSVWGYVGRTYLIEQQGVRRAVAVLSTLVEVGLFVGSGLTMGLFYWLQPGAAGLVGAAIALAMVIGLTIAPLAVNREQRFQVLVLIVATATVMGYMIFWAIYGLSIMALIHALVPIISGAEIVSILSGFAVAWLAGFLAVFVPGGLGVREAGIALILEPITGSVVAIFTAILSRLINLGVDALLFTAALSVK